MNLDLDPVQLEMQALARRLAEKQLKPRAEEVDRTAEYPWDHVQAMAQLGFCGLSIPEEYGGVNAGALTMCLVVEEVARGCPSTAAILMAYVLGVISIIRFGTPEQKRKYLPDIAGGKKGICVAITESHAGSDVAAIRSTARSKGDKWVLNGVKSLIGNVGPADLCVVAVKTDPVAGHKGISTFLIEKGTPGLRVGRIEEKMSMRGTVTGELVMEDVTVLGDHVLGEVGSGFKNIMKSLDLGRLAAAAQAIGIAQAAYEEAVRYSQDRTAFGMQLAQHQSIAFKIADMATQVHAARVMLHHACALFDAGKPHSKEASMVKLFASEAATRVTHSAQQVFGGWGIIKGNVVERLYRDARVTEIYEGTSEIQRMVISRHILGRP